jgi:hypothetical protein
VKHQTQKLVAFSAVLHIRQVYAETFEGIAVTQGFVSRRNDYGYIRPKLCDSPSLHWLQTRVFGLVGVIECGNFWTIGLAMSELLGLVTFEVVENPLKVLLGEETVRVLTLALLCVLCACVRGLGDDGTVWPCAI